MIYVLCSIIAVICTSTLIFSIFALKLSIDAKIEVDGFKKSTHQLTMVPANELGNVEPLGMDEESIVNKDYEEFNKLYKERMSDEYLGMVDTFNLKDEKAKRSY